MEGGGRSLSPQPVCFSRGRSHAALPTGPNFSSGAADFSAHFCARGPPPFSATPLRLPDFLRWPRRLLFATWFSTAVVEPPSPATKVLSYFYGSFRSGGWRLSGAPEGGGGSHPNRPRNKHILIIYVFPTFLYPDD